MPASFDVASVEAVIAETQFAGSVQHFASVGSTNTLALEAAQAGAATGVWVADEQTAGRGRGGHTWHSSAGDGLYVSVLVRPRLELAHALWISFATGMAVQTAIAATAGVRPDIRWPNDLLIEQKKCGGILVETSIEPGKAALLRHAVIGIGINVNHAGFPEELAALATSLRLATGRAWPREALLAALLRTVHEELRRLESEGSSVLERFAQASSWVQGKQVEVGQADRYTGVTAGLSPEGFLMVDSDDGVRRLVLTGGVRAR